MKRISLDSTDIRILDAVQKNGRLSKMRLAEEVHLSPTPCWARLDKLIKAGLIRGYYADIALDLITDFTKVVVTLSLTQHRTSDFELFETYIRNTGEVIDCIATGGGTDYILTIVTPNLAAFQLLMANFLSAGLGIDRYTTYIVTRDVKSSPPNLAHLIPEKAR